jgi:hypothetical protein
METTTPNFGWPVPTSTDLVKDGATAIEALGDAIDTSIVDLKGGTTGQVLAKASGTDMDFSWVAQDDSNAIQNSIINAKGDLIVGTANDTPGILSVSQNGDTIVADSSQAVGLRYQGNYAAGKNAIINGAFDVWQRGTSISLTNNTTAYTCDRFYIYTSFSAGTSSVSRQTFTPGTAPVAGYEGQYFARYTAGSTVTYFEFGQRIENVQTFAGQTATVSFWAKASANTTVSGTLVQNFGSGGSGAVSTGAGSHSVTTSWTRFTATVSVPSISGKTIGTGNYLNFVFASSSLTGSQTVDFWGVQVEAGSVATAFQTATGTIQGELAACQRYYQRFGGPVSNPGMAGYGYSQNNTSVVYSIPPLTQMRIQPSAIDYSGLLLQDNLNNTITGFSSVVIDTTVATAQCFAITLNKSAAFTAGRTFRLLGNSSSDYVGFSAEL